jgi:hypothetical protein
LFEGHLRNMLPSASGHKVSQQAAQLSNACKFTIALHAQRPHHARSPAACQVIIVFFASFITGSLFNQINVLFTQVAVFYSLGYTVDWWGRSTALSGHAPCPAHASHNHACW